MTGQRSVTALSRSTVLRVGAVAAVGVLLAACSSSSKTAASPTSSAPAPASPTASASSAAASAAPASSAAASAAPASSAAASAVASAGPATGSPVQIMVLGSLQSQALSVPGILYGTQAAVDDLNQNGGLGGHKVVVESCNDQLDINQAAACARKAVTDKDIAVVGALTIYGDAVIPILKAAGIPDVGPFPLSPLESNDPDSFPVQGGNLMESLGVAQLMKNNGVTSVNQIEVDSVAGHTSSTEVKNALTKLGITVKNTIFVPQTTSDMSAAVKSASGGGVGGITTNLAPPQVVPLLTAAKQQGITQKLGFASTILDPGTLKEAGANADGVLAAGSFPSLTQTSLPAIAQYNADMTKYQPGKALDDFSLNGWAAVQLLKLAAGSLTNLTSATLVQALNSVNNADFLWIKGFSTQPNPTPGFSRIFNTTVFFEKVVNGAFVQQGDPTKISS